MRDSYDNASDDAWRADGSAAHRWFAWAQTPRGAKTLERIGLPACLLIAYLHPTMLWSDEVPIRLHYLRIMLSLASAAAWLALGREIYLLHWWGPMLALILYLVGRGGHITYAALGIGTAEGSMAILLTITLILSLTLSVYGCQELRADMQST